MRMTESESEQRRNNRGKTHLATACCSMYSLMSMRIMVCQYTESVHPTNARPTGSELEEGEKELSRLKMEQSGYLFRVKEFFRQRLGQFRLACTAHTNRTYQAQLKANSAGTGSVASAEQWIG